MEWEVVEIKSTGGKNAPFVSIGRGALSFNAAACDLVNDDGSYKYAQILKGKENGKPIVAVKFLKQFAPNAISITRKVQNGKEIKGMGVVHKDTITNLFGKAGSNDGTVRYSVELAGENILKIID